MGYETRIAEGDAGLSGGQRQRLALAHALAHKPAILVQDEATSHLDVITESHVDQSLSDLSCTRIVIAHRLSTIRNADLILVFDGEMVVERDSHEDLIAQDGLYASLVHNQIDVSKSTDGNLQAAADNDLEMSGDQWGVLCGRSFYDPALILQYEHP